jgi:hypothetical protein
MKRVAVLVLLGSLLTACQAGTTAPAATDMPALTLAPTFSPVSVLPTATMTPNYEPSPTPDIPRPTISSNLSPQNNATTVLENGQWVVKNAAGQITATWDSAKGEWTYNYENINMQVGIAEPRYIQGWPYTIREGVTVTVPNEMLQPLDPSQQDPDPLVPSGYYGDYEQTTTKGVATMAEIGVDYRGITLIDEHGYRGTEQYAIVFTVQYKDHPDVMNVLLFPMDNTHTRGLFTDLFPAGSTDPGTNQAGPSLDDFIKILQDKNPVGRRMSIFVYVSDTMREKTLGYSPDHKTMVDTIAAGNAIPAGLDVRLSSHDIRMPHDLRQSP